MVPLELGAEYMRDTLRRADCWRPAANLSAGEHRRQVTAPEPAPLPVGGAPAFFRGTLHVATAADTWVSES